MSVHFEFVEPGEDWLRGRLAECREELEAALKARSVWEIGLEIEELEFLLGVATA